MEIETQDSLGTNRDNCVERGGADQASDRYDLAHTVDVLDAGVATTLPREYDAMIWIRDATISGHHCFAGGSSRVQRKIMSSRGTRHGLIHSSSRYAARPH